MNLTMDPGYLHAKDAIIAAGAVPLLLVLLRCGQPAAQEVAAAALVSLAHESQQAGKAIIAAGALPVLVAALGVQRPRAALSMAILRELAIGSQQAREAIIAAGAWPLLMHFLRSEQYGERDSAAVALSHLAVGSQQNMDVFVTAGAVHVLVAMLQDKQLPVQVRAVCVVHTSHCCMHLHAFLSYRSVQPMHCLASQRTVR